jgi:hypothetical protein
MLSIGYRYVHRRQLYVVGTLCSLLITVVRTAVRLPVYPTKSIFSPSTPSSTGTVIKQHARGSWDLRSPPQNLPVLSLRLFYIDRLRAFAMHNFDQVTSQ